MGDLAATAALSGSGGGGSSSLGGGGGPLSPVGRGGIKHLLPELRAEHAGRKCIVIDLDETLVHSSFKVRTKTHRVCDLFLFRVMLQHCP